MSLEKQESSTLATCVRLSMHTTFWNGDFTCSPDSSVRSSTFPKVVRIPVCPVGTVATMPKIIQNAPMSARNCLGLIFHVLTFPV